MTPAQHLFADRLNNITVTGHLIRLELGTLHPPIAEGQKPQLVPTQTLVMPLEGFLPSFAMMESVMKRLIDSGVLKVQAPQDKTHSVQ
jgi:hypothetical protein